jgi:hypothetical protein
MKRRLRRCIASAVVFASIPIASSAHADDFMPTEPAPTTSARGLATAKGDPEPATAPLAPAKPPTPVGLRLDGGYTFRRLVELPVTGADMGLAIGAQPESYAAVWGVTRLGIGSTENGLSLYTWRIGADFDYILDRIRVGMGVNLFIVGVSRAVRSDTIVSWGPAVHGGLRVDIIQADGFALFARADIDAGWELYNSSIYWGPTFGGGVDFDIHGKRSR